jgi:hypothetical protein
MVDLGKGGDDSHPAPAVPGAQGGKFGGRAECTIKKADGTEVQAHCSVAIIYATEAAARSAMKAELKAQAAAKGGKISGEIMISLERNF